METIKYFKQALLYSIITGELFIKVEKKIIVFSEISRTLFPNNVSVVLPAICTKNLVFYFDYKKKLLYIFFENYWLKNSLNNLIIFQKVTILYFNNFFLFHPSRIRKILIRVLSQGVQFSSQKSFYSASFKMSSGHDGLRIFFLP